MSPLRAGGLALCAALLLATPPAAAVIDYDVDMELPHWDLAIGLTGGIAFGEASDMGWLSGVDVGVLHDALGLHVGLRIHREGLSERVGGIVEVTAWYIILLGLGVRVGWMNGDGGQGVPDSEVGVTFLVAAPFPIARLGDGDGGSLVLAPYARPGLRVSDGGDAIDGFHEVGLMLRWTSFAW